MGNKQLGKIKVESEQVVQLGPWTIAELLAQGIKGYGAAHKSKSDKWDKELGISISRGRALKDLYNKINKNKKREKSVFVG